MSNPVYDLEGVRGKSMKVYEDKVVINVKVGLGSLLTGNLTDGEKTIYYSDCIGVQFKKSGLAIGYIQLETATGMMNNRQNNFFNENSFTWDSAKLSNEKMEEVANYIKKKVDDCKAGRNTAAVAPAPTPADELLKYKQLLDMDAITQEEFNAKKKEILGL